MDTSSVPDQEGPADGGSIGDPDAGQTPEGSGNAPEAVRIRPEPGAPSDGTTLTAVLSSLDDDGFGGQFVVREGSEVECLTCGTVSSASRFVPRRSRRLEGASDPDDLVHVVATTCPACNVGGTLVLGYGVNASPDDGDVSRALDMDAASVQVPDGAPTD